MEKRAKDTAEESPMQKPQYEILQPVPAQNYQICR